MATKKKPAGIKKSSGKKKAKLSNIAKRARTLGLESMGYGRWGKLGRVTHRTSGGQLVAVKDSKKNRKTSQDGKKKAHEAFVKLSGINLEKTMKVRKAIVLAKKAGNHERVEHLEKMLAKLREEKKRNHERHARLMSRMAMSTKKPAAAPMKKAA